MINILNKCKVNHTGFTLAEVLITLGIIGVVAAMTIPTLTSKIQNLQYATAYRKAFSSLNQALRLMQNDGYDIDLSNPGAVFQADGIIGENFKILSTYFTGATTCFEHNAKKCFECDKGQSGDREVFQTKDEVVITKHLRLWMLRECNITYMQVPNGQLLSTLMDFQNQMN